MPSDKPCARVLVIPSIREQCLRDFLRAWEGRGGWDQVFLVEDNPERTFTDVAVDRHYSWKEIGECTGPAARIFSRRDSAVRAFGFYAAYWAGAEYVLTLDDDCLPHDTTPLHDPHGHGGDGLFGRHVRAMTDQPVWLPSVPGRRTRGLPYANLGRLEGVLANVGLWTGAGDPDAVEALHRRGAGEPDWFEDPPRGSRVVPSGQLIPICGMNLCVHRSAIPFCYYPPMGQGTPYARYDDIWMGLMLSAGFRHFGWCLAVGEPWVRHARASDPFKNLVKEAPGFATNEALWEDVRAAAATCGCPPACGDAARFMRMLGARLRLQTSASDPEYVRRLGEHLDVWADLFVEAPKGL